MAFKEKKVEGTLGNGTKFRIPYSRLQNSVRSVKTIRVKK